MKVEGNSATIGITDHAQDHLGDVVYVELPEVGNSVKQGEGFGAVESVKATSDVYSPVSGKVVGVNEELTASPGLVTNLEAISSNLFAICYCFLSAETDIFTIWIAILFIKSCFIDDIYICHKIESVILVFRMGTNTQAFCIGIILLFKLHL